MNCEKIKQKVGIRTVLESFNLFPVKENGKTAFYFALDRDEKIPSLSVDFIKNVAFDFGTGMSYDIISIVQQLNKCSVSEALKYLEKFDFSVQYQKEEIRTQAEYRIIEIKKIQNPTLIQYLKIRKVYEQRYLVKELHYQLNGRNYFGIGFENNSGGFEIRNPYSKICLGKKDVTLIQGEEDNKEITLFEGFLDYLTFRNLEKTKNSDYLILNSTIMLFKVVEKLNEYDKIYLFLDNDENGRLTTAKIQSGYKDVEDCSLIYHNYKDLNEWFCQGYIE
ncbi:toprim domain-containing protein [Chryseobacterium rhizoplanae]|uniref:toprim domain-containing protein n=1 Tax=Chryseobacterium rhizoplanae TaxID=1609531 RepID=UPI001CE2C8FA|nr:toprim domain-containing protein [Chryseobacterium rhizoplanae]UCA58485.1 toprim domain-containing protein [Chryseobacterium rhizoplanae]